MANTILSITYFGKAKISINQELNILHIINYELFLEYLKISNPCKRDHI